MYQIKSCVCWSKSNGWAEISMSKPNLQNANKCMNSVLKPAGLKKCKSISEVAEKLGTTVKKQENQVILSLLNQEEWTLFETYKKYAIGDRYCQMSMNKKIFLRRINAYISFVNTPVTFLPQIYLFLYQNMVFYILLLKFLMKCLILLVIFFKIWCLLYNVQDQKHV